MVVSKKIKHYKLVVQLKSIKSSFPHDCLKSNRRALFPKM